MTYPHFIEVHGEKDLSAISINIANIVGFAEYPKGHCVIKSVDDGGWHTDESYEDVKRLIRDAGCLIAKADPRLENLPVSWDVLTSVDMIGEPVWNSNTRRWMLLIDSANDRTWVELINHAGGHEKWIEHDLRKFPLYRMRK